jgi:adenosylhomocysteine nucleosidase
MVYRNVRGPLPGQMTSWFYRPDPDLLRLAKSSIRSYEPEEIVVEGARYRPTVLTGVVTASDLFGVSDAKIADMKAKLDPDIMEMESAAIAQVCHQLEMPHIVFRAGSNRTQSNPGNDYRRLGQIAAAAAARWTIHFAGCLAERG